MNKTSSALLLVGIFLIAGCLRVTFTGVSPLLHSISQSFSLSDVSIGILTTLPLLAFAIISPISAGLAHRFGAERVLFAAMLIILLGIICRSLGNVFILYAGTALIGCGIALCNVLLPSLVKRHYPQRVAEVIGKYSLVMGLFAAAGSAAMVPLTHLGIGWTGALLTQSIFPLVALIVWLPQLKSSAPAPVVAGAGNAHHLVWRSKIAWHVTLFLGSNSLIYYVIVSWLPAILTTQGYSSEQAGTLHGLMQLTSAIPGLLAGIALRKLKGQQGITVILVLLCTLSLLGLLTLPGLSGLWVALFGFSCGAVIILGLTFIGLRSGSALQAAALSGMAQCVGYLLAAFGPPLMGKLHDLSGSWHSPLMILVLLSLLMAYFGYNAAEHRGLDHH